MTSNTPLNQLWLINPRSGNGRGAKVIAGVQGIAGVSAAPIDFTSLGSQIEEATSDATIVVAGGDGTFSSVLGRPEVGNRRVACIPLGTANDLARELGISRCLRGKPWCELPTAIETLPSSPFAVWSLLVDGKEYPCANYVSIGYEGAVVDDFARWRSNTRLSGRLANRCAYTVFGLKRSLYKIRGLSLQCDDAPPIPCTATTGLILTNIKSHLGLGLSNPISSPHDDTVECVAPPTVLGFTRMIAASVGVCSPPPVLARGKTILVTKIPSATPLQIDGEAFPPICSGELRLCLRHFVSVCKAPAA
jgi:diacylglycerol kinase family enzyme